jgi:hypothetical protein
LMKCMGQQSSHQVRKMTLIHNKRKVGVVYKTS